MAVGFVIAALRNLAGPTLRDPILLTVGLATAGLLALNGGAYTVVTGAARIGQSGCFVVEAPLSYAIGLSGILIALVALYAAAAIALSSDDST